MAVTVQIKWDEGPLNITSNGGSGTIEYLAYSDDPLNDGRDDVMSAVLSAAPDDLYGLVIDSASVERRVKDDGEALGEAIWDCSVGYVAPNRKQPYTLGSPVVVGQPRPVRWSIRNAGGAALTQLKSKEFIGESTYKDFGIVKFGTNNVTKNLLGWKRASNSGSSFVATGVSAQTYTVELVVETVATAAEMSGGYGVNLAAYAGKNVINSVAWKGFPIRCLQFVGCVAKQRTEKREQYNPDNNDQPWDLTLTFSYQPPETIDYPTDIAPINPGTGNITEKKGFEYLDIMYMEVQVTVGGKTVSLSVPARYALHRNHEEVNFDTDLGLGATL